jgi:hypothetical protein
MKWNRVFCVGAAIHPTFKAAIIRNRRSASRVIAARAANPDGGTLETPACST